MFLHLKVLPWTAGKIDHINSIWDDICKRIAADGKKEVYTIIRSHVDGLRLAPHFNFYPIMEYFNNDKKLEFTIFKRDI